MWMGKRVELVFPSTYLSPYETGKKLAGAGIRIRN